MLKLVNISKQFGQRKILQQINATVHKGDFIIMVGANGSGKSTLFNIISGSLAPDTGSIIMHNTDITAQSDIQRTQWIAQLFQNPRLNTFEHMSVAENLSLAFMKGITVGLKPGQKVFSDNILTLIKTEYQLDLSSLLHKKMGALSGGQRQLIAFIMATIRPPQLLLLDEPTAALDPQAATALLASAHRFIKTHHMTAILVTHDPQLALTLGNKLWILKDGHLQQFNQDQKNTLSAQDLVGQIDYDQIKKC